MDFLEQLTCAKANDLDLVDYLAHLGIQPAKIRKQDYWYLSPIRDEKTPSFKVNRKLNRWYDHGIAEGGTLVDFGIRFFKCGVAEFLNILNSSNSSIHQPIQKYERKIESDPEDSINVSRLQSLSSPALLAYLNQRGVAIKIAKEYCLQVDYQLNNKSYFGIGFKNDSGGYEIRNSFSKYSCSPKDISTFDTGFKTVSVFEGFMDFLSFVTLQSSNAASNYLVLNGIGLFERARPYLESHQIIDLFLDRDKAGFKVTNYALSLNSKYQDRSNLYDGFKDLNHWLMQSNKSLTRNRRQSL